MAQNLRRDEILTPPPFHPLPLIITLRLPFSLSSTCQARDRVLAVVEGICVCEERGEEREYLCLSVRCRQLNKHMSTALVGKTKERPWEDVNGVSVCIDLFSSKQMKMTRCYKIHKKIFMRSVSAVGMHRHRNNYM